MLDLRDPTVRIKFNLMDKPLQELIRHRGWARSRAMLEAIEADDILDTICIWELFAACYLIIMGEKHLPETASASQLANRKTAICNTAANFYKEEKHWVFLNSLLRSQCSNQISRLAEMLNACYQSGSTVKVPGLFAHFSSDIWAAARAKQTATARARNSNKRAICLIIPKKEAHTAKITKKSEQSTPKPETTASQTLPGSLNAFTDPDRPLPAATFAPPAPRPARISTRERYAASLAYPPQSHPECSSALNSLLCTETLPSSPSLYLKDTL